ncbi:iron-containing alcohol dehydrogenase family protein [Marinilactibacillus kalidii]|uniref:iron-containing alcohol dehydrogenase family protein n=1 Tax=Marinilactibacillus kalidii TaxID=2820274 RepID=UPI001ABDF731|nr:iron-containing alcohol dehydrogenase family protein [Marinilactibacillus kalidii]
MKLSQTIRSGPDQYICTENALSLFDEKLKSFEKPVIITGDLSYKAFLKHYPGHHAFPVFRYDHTASVENMQQLADLCTDSDCIIGIGGGKVLDTAKGTADMLGIEYVTVPTVLGTCAAYTPISATYHPDGTFRSVDYYNRSAFLCLVDLNLLVESPKVYFAGGIGDTLAKWYEAEGITTNVKESLPVMVTVGLQTAKVIQETLLKDSQKALESMDAQEISPEFVRVVEAVIAIAGTVGGFAGEYGRMAGGHAVHNGMSLIPETRPFEHGIKVAYGVLVQLIADERYEEVRRLLPFYESNAFPTKLSAFGIQHDLENKMKKIAIFAASEQETFRLVVPQVTTEKIYSAMAYLEKLNLKKVV